MRKHIAICIAVLAACWLLVAGCGDGDSDADAQQVDKATFVKQANTICQKASGRLAAEVASISSREEAKPGSDYAKTQMIIVRQAMIPRIDEELRNIRALGLPDEAKNETEAFLKAYQLAIEKMKADVKTVSEGSLPFEAVEVAGIKFGVSECPIAPVTTG